MLFSFEGKTVGNLEAMSWKSACDCALVAIKMSLPERENWKSLTAVEPMVFVSLTAKLRLGCSQSDERVGNGASPQKLPDAPECTHLSLMYLTIKFVLLVMLASKRS